MIKLPKSSHLALLLSFVFLLGCGKEFAPLYEKAQKEFERKNYIGAVDAVQAALPIWKESDGKEKRGQAYQILGRSYHKLLKFDKAIEAYSQAISLSKDTYQSAYNLGLIYLSGNKLDLAAKAYKTALRIKEDDPLALLGLGNVYFALKRYRLAKDTYYRILQTSPGVKDALEQIRLVKAKLKTKQASKRKKSKKKPKGRLKRHRK